MTDIGREWEKEFARWTDGTIQPGSGNQFYAQMDVENLGFLWSLKATADESKRYNIETLFEEVRKVALFKSIQIIPGVALRYPGHDYAILEVPDMLRILRQQLIITLGKETRSDAIERLSNIPELLRDDDSGN